MKFNPGDRIRLIKDIDSGNSPWRTGSEGVITENGYDTGLRWYEVLLDAEPDLPGYASGNEMEKI